MQSRKKGHAFWYLHRLQPFYSLAPEKVNCFYYSIWIFVLSNCFAYKLHINFWIGRNDKMSRKQTDLLVQFRPKLVYFIVNFNDFGKHVEPTTIESLEFNRRKTMPQAASMSNFSCVIHQNNMARVYKYIACLRSIRKKNNLSNSITKFRRFDWIQRNKCSLHETWRAYCLNVAWNGLETDMVIKPNNRNFHIDLSQ